MINILQNIFFHLIYRPIYNLVNLLIIIAMAVFVAPFLVIASIFKDKSKTEDTSTSLHNLKQPENPHLTQQPENSLTQQPENSDLDFGDGWEYHGEVLNGRAHGAGSIENGKGEEIQGIFRDGVLSEGVRKYPDGSEYKGSLENYLPNGNGTYKYKVSDDGSYYVYVGGFYNAMRHGMGSYHHYSSDGSRTRREDAGEYHQGYIIKGTRSWIDENGVLWTFKGAFSNDAPTEGEMFSNRYHQKGRIVNRSQIHGDGIVTVKNENDAVILQLSGEFYEGKLHGKGVKIEKSYTHPESSLHCSERVTTGQFRSGVEHGYCKVVNQGNVEYEGEFESGKRLSD